MKPLVVIPTYMTDPRDLQVVLECLRSIKRTADGEVLTLVVDDGSPRQDLVTVLQGLTSPKSNDRSGKPQLEFELHCKDENTGFSKTVNVGLQRALDEGRDAILVNADVEFVDPGWVKLMVEQRNADDTDLAWVVGAKLLYPTNLIQHGGIFFSFLDRTWGHVHQYAPADLPEAQHARTLPVTGALQFIRHECLTEVGIYDDQFKMGFEDVDYCIRVFNAGRECVYQPRVRAYHFESMFRGRGSEKIAAWQQESWVYFMAKWRKQSFARFVPSIV